MIRPIDPTPIGAKKQTETKRLLRLSGIFGYRALILIAIMTTSCVQITSGPATTAATKMNILSLGVINGLNSCAVVLRKVAGSLDQSGYTSEETRKMLGEARTVCKNVQSTIDGMKPPAGLGGPAWRQARRALVHCRESASLRSKTIDLLTVGTNGDVTPTRVANILKTARKSQGKALLCVKFLKASVRSDDKP